MAENPFQTAINEFVDKQEAVQKKRAPKTTTVPEAVSQIVKEYPRGSITGAIAAGTAYKAGKQWRANVLEGTKAIQARRAQEAAAVEELARKGITAIPSMREWADAGNKPVRETARLYAKEKLFTGFPFYNTESSARIANLSQPRVILTGESVPVTEFRVNRPASFLSQEYPEVVRTTRESPVAEVRAPRTVTVETAKKIPKLTLQPTEVAGVTEATAAPFTTALKTDVTAGGFGQFGAPSRIESALPYVPKAEVNVPLRTRIPQIATGGKLGKANVGLEAALALYDIAREEGDVRRFYREAVSEGEPIKGLIGASMLASSRAGRGAFNALTAGAPEFLGVYDTIDLLRTEIDAEREYALRRGTAGYPAEKMGVVKTDGEYKPIDSKNPYLLAIEGNLAAERGIPASPMASDWYKGPEYTYYVDSKGQLQTKMQEGYAAMEEAQNQAVIANAMRYKPMFNIDPRQGALGMPMNRSRQFDVGEYVDYMRQ